MSFEERNKLTKKAEEKREWIESNQRRYDRTQAQIDAGEISRAKTHEARAIDEQPSLLQQIELARAELAEIETKLGVR